MIKILVTNGDSNTAGDEMPDPGFTWPYRLAVACGFEGISNIAQGGNSPQAICRTTIEALHELVDVRKINPEELLFGIMWGIVERTEFADENGTWIKAYPSAMDDPKIRPWYQHYQSAYFDLFRFLSSIHYLQLVLKSYGVRYFMASAVHPLEKGAAYDPLSRDFPSLRYLRGMIDWDAFHFVPHPTKQYRGFLAFAEEQDFPQFPYGHYREIAHEEYVKQHLGPWVKSRFLS